MKIASLKQFLPYGLYLYIKKQKAIHQQLVPRELLQIVTNNKKYKNIHSGKRCFILATGPSIRSQDLKPLSNEICFAVGEFFFHPDIKIINPAYHVLPPLHPPFSMSTTHQRFIWFEKYYSNTMTYFLGDNNYQYSYWAFTRKHPEYRRLNLSFLNFYSFYQLDENNYFEEKTWDISGLPFAPRTVVYIAIQVAVYMGFNEIYLLGCDHDYLLDIKRVSNHHFYDETLGTSDKEHLSKFTQEKWFEEYYFRWKQYRLMKEYLNPKGVIIYNATRGGMLDVFPRVDYEDLFFKSKEKMKPSDGE